jgi:hypothetical protein
LEALTGPRETLVHNHPSQSPAPNDQLPDNPVNDDISRIHAEVEQRFGAVIILYKDRRLLGFGGKA